MGKTEVAVQYALRHRERYLAGVYFVSADAATEVGLLQRFAKALRLGEAEEAADDVDRLRDGVHRWLEAHTG